MPEEITGISELLFTLLRIGLLIAIALTVILILSQKLKVDASPLEAFILADRAVNCVSDEDVVRLTKFNVDSLEQCYNFNENGGIKLSLSYKDKIEEISTKDYDYFFTLCEIEDQVKVEHAPFCHLSRKFVLLDGAEPASLEISIVLAKV